jgi:hypothetical protein
LVLNGVNKSSNGWKKYKKINTNMSRRNPTNVQNHCHPVIATSPTRVTQSKASGLT